jgi:aryl-alcohol dehydrogenase-like predicted oxidoreductase
MDTRQKLSDTLPPLIFGTATFNYQFNVDPYALGPTTIVQHALAHGVRAFDTSPYYGPAESILGDAFATPVVQNNYPRESYHILTKVGRLGSDSFDYSPEWVRHSVQRSCKRLRTHYLDVVYCHDVEFVSPAEVLGAIRELRRLRDEDGIVKYVGICGYPVDILCNLSEMILRETGEPLDIVQSYANFTIQNTRLLTKGLQRLVEAGVDVVPNASPLGMGLLRRQGPPIGAMGNWHPAPDGLRQACFDASKQVEQYGEKLEVIAVRFALENWLREGAKVGSRGSPVATNPLGYGAIQDSAVRLGVSVMGVSKLEELDETMRVWHSVLDGIADDYDAEPGTITPSDAVTDHEWSLHRRQQIREYARNIRDMIGPWADYAWASPDSGFVNMGNPQPVPAIAAKQQVSVLTPPDDEDIVADLGKAPDPEVVEAHIREVV